MKKLYSFLIVLTVMFLSESVFAMHHVSEWFTRYRDGRRAVERVELTQALSMLQRLLNSDIPNERRDTYFVGTSPAQYVEQPPLVPVLRTATGVLDALDLAKNDFTPEEQACVERMWYLLSQDSARIIEPSPEAAAFVASLLASDQDMDAIADHIVTRRLQVEGGIIVTLVFFAGVICIMLITTGS